ncbi:hypothetical protein GFB49_03750 [Epibacterium sp. SM1979]|uniref:Lipoprotein n=1 Tax=Tritonibacter litoralis TaxID=2662264 RepID=A0A843YEM6_9RHOB|nr:hypothetical protein [Tritonibacter litoralis]
MIRASIISLLALAGCAEAGRQAEFTPGYRGVETRLLNGDLVQFNVQMTGARHAADVDMYAECAAAQYALIRGYGFARHLRTNLKQQGGIWSADAVYTISPSLPRGLRTIDAEVVVAQCEANGIPTV